MREKKNQCKLREITIVHRKTTTKYPFFLLVARNWSGKYKTTQPFLILYAKYKKKKETKKCPFVDHGCVEQRCHDKFII